MKTIGLLIDFIIDRVRTLLRPALTVYAFWVLGALSMKDAPPMLPIKVWGAMAFMMAVFWFGERAFKSLGLDLNALILNLGKNGK